MCPASYSHRTVLDGENVPATRRRMMAYSPDEAPKAAPSLLAAESVAGLSLLVLPLARAVRQLTHHPAGTYRCIKRSPAEPISELSRRFSPQNPRRRVPTRKRNDIAYAHARPSRQEHSYVEYDTRRAIGCRMLGD
jgi:hypothetical protein